MILAGYLILGLVAGVASGLFGVGGGLLIVPALVWLFAFPMKAATGTSLVALILPVGVLAVYHYFQQGLIGKPEVKIGLLIALGLFLGAYFGAHLASQMDASLLKKGFALLLLFAAVRLWFY